MLVTITLSPLRRRLIIERSASTARARNEESSPAATPLNAPGSQGDASKDRANSGRCAELRQSGKRCGRRVSNPHGQSPTDFKSAMSTDSITSAALAALGGFLATVTRKHPNNMILKIIFPETTPLFARPSGKHAAAPGRRRPERGHGRRSVFSAPQSGRGASRERPQLLRGNPRLRQARPEAAPPARAVPRNHWTNLPGERNKSLILDSFLNDW